MAATRLTNGPAGRARRRTPVARRARRSAGLLAVVGGGTLALGMLAVPGRERARRARRARRDGHFGRFGAYGGAGHHDLRAGRQRDVGQARHLHPVRQRALHPGQPERAQRPAADAEPAQLHHRQRDADRPRAHAADRAYGRRHRDLRDRPVRQRPGRADRERVQLLHAERVHRHGRLVRVLDRPDRGLQHHDQRPGWRQRPHAGHRAGQERPGAVGALHPGGLRLRLGGGGRHRAGEHPAGHPAGLRGQLGRGQGGREPQAGEQGRGGLHGPVRALRARVAGLRQRRGARPAARRAGRLQRLQGAVRQQVHPAGDQPVRPGARPERERDQGSDRRHRVPRVRRADRPGGAGLHPGPADARRPGHLHLPVRRARQLDHRGRPGPGHRHLREPAADGECGLRHVLFKSWPRRGSPRPTRCS